MTKTKYPPVIGINGVAQAGKDTLAVILHDLYGYLRVAFADQLRDFVYNQDLWTPYGTRLNDLIDTHGWEETKVHDGYGRAILLTTGTEAGRKMDPDMWVRAAFANAPTGLLVFTDMRFPNEFDAVKARGGQTWRVTRPGVSAQPHISDTALDGHDFDAVLSNDGTVKDLADKVIHLLDPVQGVYV